MSRQTLPFVPVNGKHAAMAEGLPPAEAARLNSQGMQALRAQSFAEAERLFVSATLHDAKASALWRNVAAARRAQGNDVGELQALNAAIDADRLDFMAWLRKAELHQRTGDEAQALSAWQGVLQLAAQAGEVPPEIETALRAGREFVAAAMAKIASAVESDLEAVRAAMDETETRRSTAFVDLAMGHRQPYVNQ
jgi:aspartate beta-hydroxylase